MASIFRRKLQKVCKVSFGSCVFFSNFQTWKKEDWNLRFSICRFWRTTRRDQKNKAIRECPIFLMCKPLVGKLQRELTAEFRPVRHTKLRWTGAVVGFRPGICCYCTVFRAFVIGVSRLCGVLWWARSWNCCSVIWGTPKETNSQSRPRLAEDFHYRATLMCRRSKVPIKFHCKGVGVIYGLMTSSRPDKDTHRAECGPRAVICPCLLYTTVAVYIQLLCFTMRHIPGCNSEPVCSLELNGETTTAAAAAACTSKCRTEGATAVDQVHRNKSKLVITQLFGLGNSIAAGAWQQSAKGWCQSGILTDAVRRHCWWGISREMWQQKIKVKGGRKKKFFCFKCLHFLLLMQFYNWLYLGEAPSAWSGILKTLSDFLCFVLFSVFKKILTSFVS